MESIVQQSNGAVTLLSTLGEGTSILLTFPSASGSLTLENLADTAREGSTRSLKVLVIDDDIEVRRTLVEMLDVVGARPRISVRPAAGRRRGQTAAGAAGVRTYSWKILGPCVSSIRLVKPILSAKPCIAWLPDASIDEILPNP